MTIRNSQSRCYCKAQRINLLDKINLKESLSNDGFLPEKINFLDEDQPITSIDSRVCCISREKLVSILYKKFIELGGKVIFNHEYISFDSDSKILNFKNDQSYRVLHLAACDGIKSKIRDNFFDTGKPVYSGYSAWRCIGQNPHKDAYLQLSSNKHLVLYPITNSLSSFVGCIKTSKENNESWIAEGSIDELVQDIGFMSDNHKETVHSSNKFFRCIITSELKVSNLRAISGMRVTPKPADTICTRVVNELASNL